VQALPQGFAAYQHMDPCEADHEQQDGPPAGAHVGAQVQGQGQQQQPCRNELVQAAIQMGQATMG